MKSINKSIFLKTLECPVYAWHLYRELIPKDSSLSVKKVEKVLGMKMETSTESLMRMARIE